MIAICRSTGAISAAREIGSGRIRRHDNPASPAGPFNVNGQRTSPTIF